MLGTRTRIACALLFGAALAATPAFAASGAGKLSQTAKPDLAGVLDVLVAQAREDAGGSSIVTLQPPRQDDYRFVATLSNGVTQITGFVPDDTLRRRLAATPGVEAATLSLARGEPAGFEAGVDFGLAVLARLTEGTFEFHNGTITIEGRAKSAADYAAIEAMARPQGLDLAMGGVRLPLADPFVWSAEKSGEGGIRVSGFVPGEPTRSRLTEVAGTVTSDTAAVADGAPDGFEDSAAAGLTVLGKLSSGTVRFDGEAWTIEASAETTLQAAQARTAFHAAGLDAAGWVYAVTLPAAPPVEAPPEVADYIWSAEKLPAGTIALTGYVPNDGLRRVLALRAGDPSVNEQSLGAGAPDGFPLDALAALDALKMLDEGRVAFADGQWSVIGKSGDPDAPAAVTAALGERAAAWQVAVTAPPPPPPLADPFVWSATKAADGSISFGGYVVTDELRRFAVARADNVTSDTTEIASGAPEGFITDVIAALDALAQLENGDVRFNGSGWSLSGKPETVSKRDASLAALATASTPAASWTVTLEEPPAPPVEVAAVDPAAPLEEPAPLETPAAEPEAEAVVESEAEAAAEPEALTQAGIEPAEVAATPTEPETTADAEPAVAEAPAEATVTPPEAAEPTAEVAVAEEAAPEADATVEEPEAPAETQVADVAPEAVETPKIAAPSEAVVSIPSRVVFDATRTEGSPIVLTGEVSTEPARAYFGVIAGKVATDGMTVTSGLPEDFIPNADAGLRILANLYDGRLAFDGTHWYLTGTANTETERAALAEQALITLPASGQWVTGIAVTPPIKLCRLTVTSFATDNPILFQSGSARMTDESMASLGELATDLQFCPDTAVYVEGHTDADGPDDLNLALSVARAEAVVDALVGLGVGYQRLYVVGYGESLPIADNETAAGKRANRRIVFTIEDKEQ